MNMKRFEDMQNPAALIDALRAADLLAAAIRFHADLDRISMLVAVATGEVIGLRDCARLAVELTRRAENVAELAAP